MTPCRVSIFFAQWNQARGAEETDSVVAFGQKRALVVWARLILPNGNSIVIENLPATDVAGYAGLEDEVDFHTWQLLKGVALATLIGVRDAAVAPAMTRAISWKTLRESAQQTTNRAGQRLVERELDVQPTDHSPARLAAAGDCFEGSGAEAVLGPSGDDEGQMRNEARKTARSDAGEDERCTDAGPCATAERVC